MVYICNRYQKPHAGVVELVDTLDLGSSAERCESSSLSARTKASTIVEAFFMPLIHTKVTFKRD